MAEAKVLIVQVPIRAEDKEKLRALADERGQKLVEFLSRLVDAEWQRHKGEPREGV